MRGASSSVLLPPKPLRRVRYREVVSSQHQHHTRSWASLEHPDQCRLYSSRDPAHPRSDAPAVLTGFHDVNHIPYDLLLDADVTAELEAPVGEHGQVTHPVEEVPDYAFSGAGAFLGPDQKDLILRCSAAAVVEAATREELHRERNERIRSGGEPPDEGIARRREAVQSALSASTGESTEKISSLNFESWEGRRAAGRVCKLLGPHPDWPEARAFFEAAATWLAQTWKADRRARAQGQRDHHAEHNLRGEIASFALKLPKAEALLLAQPFLELVASEPREVADFVHDLIAGADGTADDSFWPLWQRFADATVAAPWVERLLREQPYEKSLIQRLFLLTYWKEGIQDWDRLDGEVHRVHSLAECLPPAAVCVEAYARFLYTIGQQSLPDAFMVVDGVVARGHGAALVSEPETAFYLESLLGRFVYGQPHRLKVDHRLRDAVLRLLDLLVVAGSSAAYRMRDDFVTPIRSHST